MTEKPWGLVVCEWFGNAHTNVYGTNTHSPHWARACASETGLWVYWGDWEGGVPFCGANEACTHKHKGVGRVSTALLHPFTHFLLLHCFWWGNAFPLKETLNDAPLHVPYMFEAIWCFRNKWLAWVILPKKLEQSQASEMRDRNILYCTAWQPYYFSVLSVVPVKLKNADWYIYSCREVQIFTQNVFTIMNKHVIGCNVLAHWGGFH